MEKYDIVLDSGESIEGIDEQEVARYIIDGRATTRSTANFHGASRVSTIKMTVRGIEKTVEEMAKHPEEMAKYPEGKQVKKDSIMLTTETLLDGYGIGERRDIVSAECVFGMNLFLDMFSGIRDFLGGRSRSTQNILKKSMRVALDELREEAVEVGANAVIGVSVSYENISGKGQNMMMVVATGTAVVLSEK